MPAWKPCFLIKWYFAQIILNIAPFITLNFKLSPEILSEHFQPKNYLEKNSFFLVPYVTRRIFSYKILLPRSNVTVLYMMILLPNIMHLMINLKNPNNLTLYFRWWKSLKCPILNICALPIGLALYCTLQISVWPFFYSWTVLKFLLKFI